MIQKLKKSTSLNTLDHVKSFGDLKIYNNEVPIQKDPRFHKMWNENQPTKKIAQELSCSRRHVLRVAKRLKMKPATERVNAPMGDMFDKYIIEYHEQKMPILKQADKIGVGLDFIKKRRRILGLSVPSNRKKKQ